MLLVFIVLLSTIILYHTFLSKSTLFIGIKVAKFRINHKLCKFCAFLCFPFSIIFSILRTFPCKSRTCLYIFSSVFCVFCTYHPICPKNCRCVHMHTVVHSTISAKKRQEPVCRFLSCMFLFLAELCECAQVFRTNNID